MSRLARGWAYQAMYAYARCRCRDKVKRVESQGLPLFVPWTRWLLKKRGIHVVLENPSTHACQGCWCDMSVPWRRMPLVIAI